MSLGTTEAALDLGTTEAVLGLGTPEAVLGLGRTEAVLADLGLECLNILCVIVSIRVSCPSFSFSLDCINLIHDISRYFKRLARGRGITDTCTSL